MTQIPNALLEPPAPPAPQGKEPPGSAPDTPFAAVLDDHQARTAVAEGHDRADEAPADDARREPDTSLLAALLGGVPLAADAAAAVADAAAGSAEPGPLGGRVLSPGESIREQARGFDLTRATRPIGVPADATALPLRPPVPMAEGASAEGSAASLPSLSIGLDAAAAGGRGEGSGAAAAGAAVARATRLADVLQAAGRLSADAAGEPAATPGPATVAGAAGHGQGEANGSAPAQPATPAAPTAPPVAPTAPFAGAPASAPAGVSLPVRSVGLEHAVETVRLALRHGAERGVTHARISLTPRELGSVEVHLRQTAEGLVARVVAEHGVAAQQLQQAGAELRRSLEQQGVTLLQLDIGASGEDAANRRGAAFDTAAGFGDGRRGERRDGADPLGPLDGAADADLPAATTLQLPNGALVDVLA